MPRGGPWLRRGVILLSHELSRQILGDGGHCERSPSVHFDILRLLVGLRVAFGTADHTDRKSTRLNSSHLGNSYAVFCSKKKKIFLDEKKGGRENGYGTAQDFPYIPTSDPMNEHETSVTKHVPTQLGLQPAGCMSEPDGG